MDAEDKNIQHGNISPKISPEFVPAIRLMSNQDGSCTFEEGKIPALTHINANVFGSVIKQKNGKKTPILLHEDNMLLPLKEL
ncbi:hypothetical protein QWZ06_25395 [Chryseobacterium tructae]|uniref:hypothetical protein n=1 Tax=Chryseobacterium tructae TaxID=1037380 RepID=UPI0025B5CD64|nr:hypothetical protein [Chryseobacterium tructae]MDN3695330.1 hypothetical protein [Chryseobacterium tructae]